MKLEQIKKEVEMGKSVYWKNHSYKVVLTSKGEWFIKCLINNHCIGLTWADGVTLNGNEEDFFMPDVN
ncbi:hypothetical protein [Gimesia chilikensis]|uniref:Uncharacterized protein n=1 Tax=Gimesia chilikensis TaxID=2605989 RepID=A0A517PVW6_9PLAN|nr:hypothetical protein [Gimesia chilikensis]QDT23517.1 hypothetical protein HG66A1_53380 [Gimesia chilikensis]|tara:strand:- start:2589 stop:2792 length:204 start_codon:yes stop_codon:yes gene_type:complete